MVCQSTQNFLDWSMATQMCRNREANEPYQNRWLLDSKEEAVSVSSEERLTCLLVHIRIGTIGQDRIRGQCFHHFEIALFHSDHIITTIVSIIHRWLEANQCSTIRARSSMCSTSLEWYSHRPSMLNLYSCLPSGSSRMVTKSLSLQCRCVSLSSSRSQIYLFTMVMVSFQLVNEPAKRTSLSLGDAGYLKTTGIVFFSSA